MNVGDLSKQNRTDLVCPAHFGFSTKTMNINYMSTIPKILLYIWRSMRTITDCSREPNFELRNFDLISLKFLLEGSADAW